MNDKKHCVICDGECVRIADTVQECIAYSVRLTEEARDVGLVVKCSVEEDKGE
jgi:hypothetical protein